MLKFKQLPKIFYLFKTSRCNFYKLITSPKNLKFELKPLILDNIEENLIGITENFFRYEPVISSMYEHDYSKEKIFRPTLLKSIRENLGVACYELETGKWAACLASEDFFTSESDSFLTSDEINAFIVEFFTFCEERGFHKVGFKSSRKKYDEIHLIASAVSKEFVGNNLLKYMCDFMLYEHPITKNSSVFFSECTNKFSSKALNQAGLKSVVSFSYQELANDEFFKKKYDKKFFEKIIATNEIISFHYFQRNVKL